MGWVSQAGRRVSARRRQSTHEGCERSRIDAADHASDYLALALHSADDRRLAGADATSSTALAVLVDMPVFGKTADEGFVDLDDAHELAEIFAGETSAKPVAHIPGRSVRAEAHHPVNLERTDPFLTGQHQMDHSKPLAQRLIGVLKDRPADMRKAVVGSRRGASVAEPIPFHLSVRSDLGIAASRANDKFGPAMLGEIEAARVFVGESCFPLRDRHLSDLFGLFGARHIGFPLSMETA